MATNTATAPTKPRKPASKPKAPDRPPQLVGVTNGNEPHMVLVDFPDGTSHDWSRITGPQWRRTVIALTRELFRLPDEWYGQIENTAVFLLFEKTTEAGVRTTEAEGFGCLHAMWADGRSLTEDD